MMITIILAAVLNVAVEEKPPVVWKPAYSGNYTTLNTDRGIDYVVIHTSEGSNCGHNWFANPASQVSAHYGIEANGEIHQMVEDKNRAWHAGNSWYNQHSIGIEHAGYNQNAGMWTETMYQTSAKLVRWLCQEYNIPKDRQHIIGHVEVPGATHTDPGPNFNWTYFMSLVQNGGNPPPPPPPAAVFPKAKQVTAATLNVRSGPATTYSIKGTIPSGSRYVAIAASGSWLKIYFDGTTGWIHSSYVTATAATAAKINVSALNVRSGPSTGYSVVGTAHTPEMYVRITTSGSWKKVHFGGSQYWVHGGYTSDVNLN